MWLLYFGLTMGTDIINSPISSPRLDNKFFHKGFYFATTRLKLFGADLFYMLKFTQHKLVFQTKVASKRKWKYLLNHGQITYTPFSQGSFVQLNKQQPCNEQEGQPSFRRPIRPKMYASLNRTKSRKSFQFILITLGKCRLGYIRFCEVLLGQDVHHR